MFNVIFVTKILTNGRSRERGSNLNSGDADFQPDWRIWKSQ